MSERSTDSDLSGLRVLVVEDEFPIALSIEQALAGAGCEVFGRGQPRSA